MVNGKGDAPRPVDKNKFDSNYDEIRWNDRRSVDCKSCTVGCGYFQETGMVCFPRQEQQEPEQIRLREEGQEVAKDQSERPQAEQKESK
jgi:hypothetical protein